MADAIAGSEAKKWNVPPADKSGGVSKDDRKIIKSELMGTAIWEARPNEPREKELIEELNDACRKMDIHPVPKLFIYLSNKPNAASNRNKSIYFSTNLLDTMTPDQVKAVMGHELVHNKHHNLDLITDLAVDIGVIGAYVALREKFIKPSSKLVTSKLVKFGEFLGVFAALEVLGLWRSRLREYRSDTGGANVAGTSAMVGALESLHARTENIVKQEERTGKTHYWMKYAPEFLKSHPSDEHRIQHLIKASPVSFIERHVNEAANATETTR